VPPRPKPWRLIVGPFELEGVTYRHRQARLAESCQATTPGVGSCARRDISGPRYIAFAGRISPPGIAPQETRLSPCKRNRRTLMASFMLVAFALRVLIPPGFMPASDRPFSLEICWEGLPADMQGHVEHAGSMGMDSMDMASMGMDQGPGHHHETSSHSEHCVFGTACGAGPFSHLTLPSDFSSAHQLLAIAFASIAIAVHVVYLPPPRAPPRQLS
jgi:hypothetical protein